MPNYHLRALGWLTLAAVFVLLGVGSLVQHVSWAGYAWLAIAAFYVLVALLALRKASLHGPGPPPEPAAGEPPPAATAGAQEHPPPGGESRRWRIRASGRMIRLRRGCRPARASGPAP